MQTRGIGDVGLEGFLGTDLLLVDVRNHRTIVDAGRALLQAFGVAAEQGPQPRRRGLAQVTERVDAECLDFRCRLRAEAEQFSNGQRVEQVAHVRFAHDDEAVRLAQVGCDLGDQLVGRNAHGRSEFRPLTDAALDFARNVLRAAEGALARGHVEKRLVERESLHQRRELVEHGEDLLRHRAVMTDARMHHDRLGATAQRFACRHCRVHAELADFVARGCDDATIAAATHDDGFAAQLRVVALLDRCVERIHVDVQDGTGRFHGEARCPGARA